MDDLDQTFVADSFAQLYRDSRHRLTVGKRELAARHELCEDLAQSLVEPSQMRLHAMGLAEDLILERTLAALRTSAPDEADAHAALLPSPTQDEAVWIVTRLAELLGWSPLAPLPAPMPD